MTKLNDLYNDYGQSPWIDNIRLDWVKDGTLERLVSEGVRGVTSNPSIFAKTLATSSAYDELVVECGDIGPEMVFEKLAATVAAAKRLAGEVGRDNVMIKIPATKEGLPAIMEVLATGINVNVTLIFSLERYGEVITAWMEGLETALARRGHINAIASVASFFVSRVDVAVDPLLPEDDPRRGTTANAQVAGAYELYRRRMASDRALALLEAGAQVQRPLWASTSTKNPAYLDLLYVDAIVADETVNTMPDVTLAATLDHGDFTTSTLLTDDGIRAAAAKLDELPEDVSLEEVTAKLEVDGVAAFSSAYDDLLATVEKKMHETPPT